MIPMMLLAVEDNNPSLDRNGTGISCYHKGESRKGSAFPRNNMEWRVGEATFIEDAHLAVTV